VLGDQHEASDATLDALESVPNRIVVGAFKNTFWDMATVFLPGRIHWEKDGSFTNFEGRVQRIRRAQTAAATCKSEGWYGLKLGQALGLSLDLATPRAIFHALAGEVQGFAGMDLETLGEHGVRLGEGRPAMTTTSGAEPQAGAMSSSAFQKAVAG